MIFEITRTSSWGDSKPCDEAFKIKVPYWEIRTCTEDEFNKRFADREGTWSEVGTDHCITDNGDIKRKLGMKTIWAVQVFTLDDLMALTNKYGELVIDDSRIEIYDSYSE